MPLISEPGFYSKNLDKGKYASEWGMYDSMDYLVAAASAGIGGIIASSLGFQTLFFLMFILSLVSIGVSAKMCHLRYK